MTQCFIGTSGFSYSHWKKVFYPPNLNSRQFLQFYTTKFTTLEINSSFYRLPQETTLQQWYRQTPSHFLFSLKASRFITHQKKLKDCQNPLKLFLKRAVLLQDKLGPILFQLPPNFPANLKRFQSFIKLLPPPFRYTFEFRHLSWFNPEIYRLLKKHRLALTIADTPQYPQVIKATADFSYWRFHGHEKLYASNYSSYKLKKWAKKVKKLSLPLNYIYFDNDAHGFAPQNALLLKKYLAS